MAKFQLIPFKVSDFSTQFSVHVDVRNQQADCLEFSYVVSGPLNKLKWPASTGHSPRHDLWKSTCFECFISPHQNSPKHPYYEWNFACDAKDWGFFAFESERKQKDQATFSATHLQQTVQNKDDKHFALKIVLNTKDFVTPGPLHLSFNTILESSTGELSYWALNHSHGKANPDFHDYRNRAFSF